MVCGFEHTINRLSFAYVRLGQLENYFSCFATFFLLFFFSSAAIYFKIAKRTVFKL